MLPVNSNNTTICTYMILSTIGRTQEEMAHTCRGTVNLAGAVVDSLNNTDFVVANGQSQVLYTVWLVFSLCYITTCVGVLLTCTQ